MKGANGPSKHWHGGTGTLDSSPSTLSVLLITRGCRQVFPGVEAASDENDEEEEEEDLRLKRQRLERANRTQPRIGADGGPQAEGEAGV